ncbi:MAG: hypothetical protein M3Y24_13580 [Acidobacteriota bacterium]|nr:hypothetical protein [Acidobacteriota bacterium]
MKKYAYVTSLLAILFAPAVVLTAQTDQAGPFIGTWQLNVAKSKYSPGPAPKSQTVTVAPEGKTTVEEVDAQDKNVTWSFTPSGDTAVPIEGLENSTVTEKRSGNTVDHVWKIQGGNTKGHGVISKSGKTMTYTMTGTDGQGRPVHNVSIFEKQ